MNQENANVQNSDHEKTQAQLAQNPQSENEGIEKKTQKNNADSANVNESEKVKKLREAKEKLRQDLLKLDKQIILELQAEIDREKTSIVKLLEKNNLFKYSSKVWSAKMVEIKKILDQ